MARKKHSLNLGGQFNVLQKLIALLAHRPIKLFSLFHVSLDDIDDKGEPDYRGEIVCNACLEACIRRAKKVVQKHADHDQRVTDPGAQKHGAYAERQNIEVS